VLRFTTAALIIIRLLAKWEQYSFILQCYNTIYMMQSYHSNRRETERTKRRAQHSSSGGGSVRNIRDASESTVFQQRTRVRVLGGWWRAQPTDGQETALQHHAASAATNVRRGRPARRRRVVGGVPATHCTGRQLAVTDEQLSYTRTLRTFRNRAMRQTAARKPQNQQRAQLSSDGDDDMM